MEYQNITLSVPREILRRAKHIAVEKGVSLSGLLTQMLEEMTRREDEYQKSKEYHIVMLNELDLGTHGNTRWTRSDLHVRQ